MPWVCRACGNEERASEGYPCTECGTFVCLIWFLPRRDLVQGMPGQGGRKESVAGSTIQDRPVQAAGMPQGRFRRTGTDPSLIAGIPAVSADR